MEDLIKALQIFLKYSNTRYPTHCEHDVMYVLVHSRLVSEEDKLTLKDLGFIEDSEEEHFYSYRYGSA